MIHQSVIVFDLRHNVVLEGALFNVYFAFEFRPYLHPTSFPSSTER